MPVRLRFDFWHLESAQGSVNATVTDVLETCRALPPNSERRLLRKDGKVVRLLNAEPTSSLWLGQFIGIGTGRPAKKAHETGPVSRIPLAAREGLVESNVFLFDPMTSVLVLQSNRLAASASSVVRFFNEFEPDVPHIRPVYVISQTGLDELGRFRVVRKFTIRLAKMRFGPSFADRGHAAVQLAGLATAIDAQSLNLEVSVGRQRRRRLDIAAIRQIVSDLFESNDSTMEIKRLEITGSTDDDEAATVDLLTQRIVEIVELDPDDDRDVSYERRRAEIVIAFRKHHAFLREQFAP